jgi:hypothetical protein
MLIEHILLSFQRYAAGGESERSKKENKFSVPVNIYGKIPRVITRYSGAFRFPDRISQK